MVRGERLSDAIIYKKLNILKNDFFGYIERNSAKVDENLPVFYGYVISALEHSFPDLTDDIHDEFIDSITFKVLDASKNSASIEYIQKVSTNALRSKKRPNADVGINIMVGLMLLKNSHYEQAVSYLKPYATLDTMLGTAVAFCYLTTAQTMAAAADKTPGKDRSAEMELMAREQMLDLARKKPPVQVLPQLDFEDASWLDRTFWHMIHAAIRWFPDERWFLASGLEKAKLGGNQEIRNKLLEIASDRFYTDMTFLREVYSHHLEQRDAGGAAGVINQMIKQFPDNLEPIYYGLKLSLLTTKKITYYSFRKLAITKKMPEPIIDLFDFAFELLIEQQAEALNRLPEMRKKYPKIGYFLTTLNYIAQDFGTSDPSRGKKAKKALVDSIDQFSMNELNIP